MAKHPKGHYSKAARHARKMASCAKCSAQAEKILQGRPRKPRAPRAPRVPRRGGMYGPRSAPKSTRASTGTMTPDQILAAGRGLAGRISSRMAARRERRMMRANSMGAM